MVLIMSMDDDIVMSHFLIFSFQRKYAQVQLGVLFPTEREKYTNIHEILYEYNVIVLDACLCKNGLGKNCECKFYPLQTEHNLTRYQTCVESCQLVLAIHKENPDHTESALAIQVASNQL